MVTDGDGEGSGLRECVLKRYKAENKDKPAEEEEVNCVGLKIGEYMYEQVRNSQVHDDRPRDARVAVGFNYYIRKTHDSRENDIVISAKAKGSTRANDGDIDAICRAFCRHHPYCDYQQCLGSDFAYHLLEELHMF